LRLAGNTGAIRVALAKFAANIGGCFFDAWKFISGAFYPVGRAEFNGRVGLDKRTGARVLCGA
jgi:hypothetical protein